MFSGTPMSQSLADIPLFFWLLLIAALVAMVARRLRLPYASALVIVGLGVGLTDLLPRGTHLDPHLLFTVLLPPLLFEAAVNLPWQRLRADWWPLTLYSLLGTIVTAVVIAMLTAWLLHLPLPVALVFGALMAPTDPISVLAIFRRLGIHQRLTLLVEGESLFNDGVGVVLFTVMLGAAQFGHFSLAAGALQFLLSVSGGVLVGLASGLLITWMANKYDDHLLEISLTTLLAYGAFLGAELLHVSGVVAVITPGLVTGSFWMPRSMSKASRQALDAFWSYAAFVANSVIFLLLGNDVAHLAGFSSLLMMVLIAIPIALAGRAVAVYGLAPLCNRFAQERIPLAWQHVLCWGGLRGALSMALVLGLYADFPYRSLLIALVFSIVFFSLTAQALTITPLLRLLKISGK